MDAKLAEDLVAAFDAVFGVHEGKRVAHAKGICCAATFTGTPAATALTRAPHMQGAPVPATVRFSNGSGDPGASDGGREPSGMAVKFHLDPRTATDIVSITWPVFVVRTPEEVLEFMRLRVPNPATGMPDLAALGRPIEKRSSPAIWRSPVQSPTPTKDASDCSLIR